MLSAIKTRGLAFWIVGLPMLVAILYYSFIAADRYVTTSIVTVRQAGDSAAAGAGGLALMLTGSAPGAREETLYLRDYILSLAMLKHLDAKLGVRKAYENQERDPLYRLYPGVSQEWLHWYYRNRVSVGFDDVSSLLTIQVEGFDPAFAQAMGAEILAQSERFVNDISQRMAREQMAFSEAEMLKARLRFQNAKARLLDFQNRHRILDPAAQAQANVSLVGQLEGEIAHKEAELKALLSYLQDDAHQVVSKRHELAALKSQLEKERIKSAPGQGEHINTLASQYQDLMLEVAFAEEAYKAALTAMETTRVEASRKLKSLVVVDPPAKAEIALYPRRIYNLVTLLVALTLLYGITRFALATIRDHRD